MTLRYFFKFDAEGYVINWQVAETEATAARLREHGYIDVGKARYFQLWQERDRSDCSAIKERTVGNGAS